MADLTENLFMDTRPRVDARQASLPLGAAQIVHMNALMRLDGAGESVSWAGAGVLQGLAKESKVGSLDNTGIVNGTRLIVDTSGPKVLVNVTGVVAAGTEVECPTDNLNDSVPLAAGVAIGLVDEVDVHGVSDLCWVQMYPREHFGS